MMEERRHVESRVAPRIEFAALKNEESSTLTYI